MRHRVRVTPDALAGGPGGRLDLRELALLVVLDVPPGEPLGDLLAVNVHAADMDVRDDPAVAVLVDLLDFALLAFDQVADGLPGDVAERLGFLGGVNAVEPDLQRLRVVSTNGRRRSRKPSAIGERSAGQKRRRLADLPGLQ